MPSHQHASVAQFGFSGRSLKASLKTGQIRCPPKPNLEHAEMLSEVPIFQGSKVEWEGKFEKAVILYKGDIFCALVL